MCEREDLDKNSSANKENTYCCAAYSENGIQKPDALIKSFMAYQFRQHYEMLIRFVRSKGIGFDEAADIVSGMFAGVVYAKISLFQCTMEGCLGDPNKCDGTAFKAWLYKIAHFKLLQYWSIPHSVDLDSLEKTYQHDLIQKAIYRRASTLQSSSELPEGLRDGLDQLMEKALQTLTSKQRQVILLMYYQGVETSTEVAEITNSTPAAVRKLKSAAIKRLQDYPELQALLYNHD